MGLCCTLPKNKAKHLNIQKTTVDIDLPESTLLIYR